MFKLKTLHGYLARDLARVTGLALVAFTLVMTVFAIVEPLRKQGLGTSQVAMLFGFTMPIMLSLTLPFAALFATAIVYGRFGQDRELLACRASGISTITVLKPAVLLGVIVTVSSLVLTNFVSPKMAKKCEQALVQNIKSIACTKIKKEGHVSLQKKEYIIHASHVDEEKSALFGVVAGKRGWRTDPKTGGLVESMTALVASVAYLDTFVDEQTGNHVIAVSLYDQVGPVTNQLSRMVAVEEVPLQNIEFDLPTKDKPALYEWKQLLATLKDPTLNGEIQDTMRKFQRVIRQNRVLQALKDSIDEGKPYTAFERMDFKYSIYAPSVKVDKKNAVLASSKTADGRIIPIVIKTINKSNGEVKTFRATDGKVITSWNQFNDAKITIKLSGEVHVPDEAQANPNDQSLRKTEWQAGGIPLPKDPVLDNATLGDIYQNPAAFTSDKDILKDIKVSLATRPDKIKGEIVAEMHSRIAFGVSCMLLVTLGAALGVIFKGGQMISAFAISVIPAAAIMVMIMMGKKMISNPEASDLGGMIAIWGGNLLLLIVDAVIYHRLSRI